MSFKKHLRGRGFCSCSSIAQITGNVPRPLADIVNIISMLSFLYKFHNDWNTRSLFVSFHSIPDRNMGVREKDSSQNISAKDMTSLSIVTGRVVLDTFNQCFVLTWLFISISSCLAAATAILLFRNTRKMTRDS